METCDVIPTTYTIDGRIIPKTSLILCKEQLEQQNDDSVNMLDDKINAKQKFSLTSDDRSVDLFYESQFNDMPDKLVTVLRNQNFKISSMHHQISQLQLQNQHLKHLHHKETSEHKQEIDFISQQMEVIMEALIQLTRKQTINDVDVTSVHSQSKMNKS